MVKNSKATLNPVCSRLTLLLFVQFCLKAGRPYGSKSLDHGSYKHIQA